MKNIMFLCLISFYALNSFAQENLTENQVKLYQEMVTKAIGTYQIQLINTRETPAIPLSLIKVIEENRSETDITYYKYTDNIRIMILPKNQIDSPNFNSIEHFKYISL